MFGCRFNCSHSRSRCGGDEIISGLSYAESQHDSIDHSYCSARVTGAGLPGVLSEVEIDEFRRAALTDGDCNDPAQEDHRPYKFRPDAAHPGLHAAVVIVAMKNEKTHDEEKLKAVRSEECGQIPPIADEGSAEHVERLP